MFGKRKKLAKKKIFVDCELKIADANERAAESYDRLVRATAEFDNSKKRQQKEMDMFKKITTKSILLEFLPIADEIEQAISAAPKEIADGLKMTRDNLRKRLEKHGVGYIKALGAKFDPNFHDAIMVMEKEDHEENTVIAVVEEGYMLGDMLVKPAKVVVSKKNLNRGKQDD